jgi:hypothetical protein
MILTQVSCTKDIYKEPLLITKIMSQNIVGDSHAEKFSALNKAYLGYLDSIQTTNSTAFKIDTTAQATARGYTLEMKLERKKLDRQFDLKHSIYLRPHGVEGELARMFGEMIYYTYDSLFFAKGANSSKHSPMIGVMANQMPTKDLKAPLNNGTAGVKRFSIDSLSFSDGFSKHQQTFFRNVLNNAFTVRQEKKHFFNVLRRRTFDYYPNFLNGANKQPTDYGMSVHFIKDVSADKLIGRIRYHGSDVNVKVPSDLPVELVFPLSDFEKGNYYEANLRLSMLVISFVSSQYMFD